MLQAQCHEAWRAMEGIPRDTTFTSNPSAFIGPATCKPRYGQRKDHHSAAQPHPQTQKKQTNIPTMTPWCAEKSVVSQNFTIFGRLEEHMSFCKKNNAVLCVSVVYWFLPEMCAVLAPFCAVFVVYLQALKMRTVLEGNSSMTQALKTALSFRCPP